MIHQVTAVNSIGIAVRVPHGVMCNVSRRAVEQDGAMTPLGTPAKVESQGALTEVRTWNWEVGDFALELSMADDIVPLAIHVLQPIDVSRLSKRHKRLVDQGMSPEEAITR